MKAEEFEKHVRTGSWRHDRINGKSYINCANICVAEVTACAADEIVENHNNKLKQGAGQ